MFSNVMNIGYINFLHCMSVCLDKHTKQPNPNYTSVARIDKLLLLCCSFSFFTNFYCILGRNQFLRNRLSAQTVPWRDGEKEVKREGVSVKKRGVYERACVLQSERITRRGRKQEGGEREIDRCCAK